MDVEKVLVSKYQDSSPLFAYYLKVLAPGIAPIVTEYKFHPTRKLRFDYANVELKVAVEIDGGQYMPGGGRHNTDTDRDKINQAVALGWRVLRFSTQQIKKDPQKCIDLYLKTIGVIE